MLTFLALAPILTGLFLLAVRPVFGARTIALVIAALEALLVIGIGFQFDRSSSAVQFEQVVSLAPVLGLQHYVGIDGIGFLFVFLTSVVFVMSLLAAGREQREPSYYGLLLMLEGALMGTFTSLNFLEFFFYWEVALIPAFLLVRKFGGGRASHAATQFFLFTMVGSVAMLVGFLGLFAATGTFDLVALAGVQKSAVQAALETKLQMGDFVGAEIKAVLFVLVFLGMAVKLPIWPLHSWLPLTYGEAPAPVTMVLTGVMSKMAVYGMVRILLPIFPDEIILLQKPLLLLAVITIVYGAFAAMAQSDIKRLFAYSSLSHLGYCALGVFATPRKTALLYSASDAAAAGVLLQALSHGLLAASLFAFVSYLEKRSNGVRSIQAFGGLRNVNPVFAALMGIAVFASLGLPGLSAFPAEFLVFQGTFSNFPLAASFAMLGVLITAVYSLTFYLRVFNGPLNENLRASPDLLPGEKAAVLPAIGLTILLGIVPQAAASFFNPAIANMVRMLS